MTETRWWAYLQKLMEDQTQLEAAKFIGISKSNITRWKDGARAAPDFVVKVARAYGANVLEALVEAEFITKEEANLNEIQVGEASLDDFSNDDLLDELGRRLDAALDEDTNIYPIGLDYTETQYVADSDSPDNDGENTDY